ncbi:MAG TPA: hypothetical protein VGH82_09945 [Gaiellaceae bacterium]
MNRQLGLVTLLLALAAIGSATRRLRMRTIVVRNPRAFERAAAALRHRGGMIVLGPGSYASLVLGPRSGGTFTGRRCRRRPRRPLPALADSAGLDRRAADRPGGFGYREPDV